MQPHAETPNFETGDDSALYNQAQFSQYMPGYEQQVSQVNAADAATGRLEVRHDDGSGTMFYDKTQFASPHGDYRVYEDAKGGQWYAVNGTPAVERQPVYENGRPVYDGDQLRTVNVDTVKYRSILSRYQEPEMRDVNERMMPPRKKF